MSAPEPLILLSRADLLILPPRICQGLLIIGRDRACDTGYCVINVLRFRYLTRLSICCAVQMRPVSMPVL